MILAVNTATPEFSLALVKESGALLAEQLISVKSKNFSTFMPAFHDLLRHSSTGLRELTAAAVAIGPGSFTGLRVGLAVTKGICHATGIPVIGVSNLEAMASQWPDKSFPICPFINARKGEVFAALFRWSDGQGLVRISPDTCLKLEDLPGIIKETSFVLGNDFDRHEAAIHQILGPKAKLVPPPFWGLRASTVGWLAVRRLKEKSFDSLMDLTPYYLKPPDIRPTALPTQGYGA